jgi:hypothetical protein
MNPIVVAVFDIETSTNQGGEPGQVPWGDHDRIGFACGVICWYAIHLENKTFRGSVLQTNCYWSPIAMLDDLLRPWAHVLCGYNAHRFDLPVLVHQAIPPLPGPWLQTVDPAVVARVARVMALAGGYHPLVQLVGPPARVTVPWWRRLLPVPWQGHHAATVEAMRAWKALGRAYSSLVPTGATVLSQDRETLLATLQARLFDPLRWLEALTGAPHVAKLDYLREGLERPEYLVDGNPVDHSAIPTMWRKGRIWEVIDICKDDVDVLCQLLHAGCYGRIFARRLNTTHEGRPVDLRTCQNAPGAQWPYAIPTDDWWRILQTIATTWSLEHAERELNRRGTTDGE